MVGEEVRLMSLAGLATMKASVAKDRAIQPVGDFARGDFLGEISDTLEHASWLVDVIANQLDLGRAREHQKAV